MTPDETIPTEELGTIADLLLGAAAADGLYDRVEIDVVVDALCELGGLDELPDDLVEHLKAFDPDAFDLERTCARIDAETPEKRRSLLQLIAKVTEADEIHDLDEEHYIIRAARALGAPPEEYGDLTYDLAQEEDSPGDGGAKDDDLEDLIEDVEEEPPPIPR